MANFKYGMGETVQLKESDEKGTIVGRAEYATSESGYLVRYCAADGRQVKDWWSESDIRTT